MKKLLSLVFAFLLLIAPSLASSIDILPLSDEELITLYANTENELHNRGIYPYVELKQNDKSDEVAKLQRRLIELGYYSKEATGKYDSNTIAAMKAFEKAAGLKIDGIASVNDQTQIFSDKAISKPTPTPKPTKKPTPKPTAKPTKKPTPKPKPTKTPDPRKAYEKFSYDDAARYPDYNKGSKVKVIGRVLQVLGNRKDGFEMRVASKGRYDDIVYLVTKGGHYENILEDDTINFYCVLNGDYTYKSTMGQSITLPIAIVDFYEYR